MSKLQLEADVQVHGDVSVDFEATPLDVEVTDEQAALLLQILAIGDLNDADGGKLDGDIDIEGQTRIAGKRLLFIRFKDVEIDVLATLRVKP